MGDKTLKATALSKTRGETQAQQPCCCTPGDDIVPGGGPRECEIEPMARQVNVSWEGAG